MGYSPAGQSQQLPSNTSTRSPKMSILAMPQPMPVPSFKRGYVWEDSNRQHDYSSRPRTQERVALPSIRQMIPELSVSISHLETSNRATNTATSPLTALGSGVTSPSEYVHSPHKRRRLSAGDDQDERVHQVPRLYNSPPRREARIVSPQPVAVQPKMDNWPNPARPSPFAQVDSLPSMRTAPAADAIRLERRPTLPSLSFMHMEQQAASMPRGRNPSTDEGYRAMLAQHNGPETEFRHGGGPSYPFQHPGRGQSLSLGSLHAFDQRSSLSGPAYGGPYPEYMRVGEMGSMSTGGDSKQRKRRGNLPKETTDKLRAWFLAHLQHPYPTEDEKQDLMKQTGLQMNQISNWFINARRRQLPTMINNAKAESDAMASRTADGKILPSTERSDYGSDKPDGLSCERDGSLSEDDLDNLGTPHSIKRGSI